MEFAARLKSLRLARGLTQQGLSDRVGVSVVSLRSWEAGAKKPAMDALISLSAALSVSVDELVCAGGSRRETAEQVLSSTERTLLKHFRAADAHGRKVALTVCRMEAERSLRREDEKPPRKSERFIPRYYTPAAAGFSAPLDGSDFEMMLADESVPADADYAVDIQGASMEPLIRDGETVFVRKTEMLSPGDIGIFAVDGAMYCKQYVPDGGGGVTLASLNPDLKDADVCLAADSGSTVRICGKVLTGKAKA